MLLGGQFQKAMATCSRVGGPHQVHRPTTHARHHFCCHLLSIIASRWPGRTSSRAGAPGKSSYGPTETMGFEEVVIWTSPAGSASTGPHSSVAAAWRASGSHGSSAPSSSSPSEPSSAASAESSAGKRRRRETDDVPLRNARTPRSRCSGLALEMKHSASLPR